MSRGALTLALGVVVSPLPLSAQVDPSVGVGAGTTRYTGGSAFSSVALTPAVQVLTPSFFTAASGSFASLPAGDWTAQLRADLWASAPTGAPVRPAAAVTVAGSVQTGGPGTGVVHALAEAVWTRDGSGAAVAAGPSVGGVGGGEQPALAGLHLRARGWWSAGAVLATAVVESWATGEGGFTEAQAGATARRGPVVATGWVGARLTGARVRVGAGAAVEVGLSPRVALEASGGRALAELWQGFPAATFGAIAVRLHAAPPRREPPRAVLPPGGPRLERVGDTVVARFAVPEARAVALAGEWTEWRTEPLTPVGDGTWEARLVLAPGTYRFNLIVDGATWIVPAGVGAVDDGMGGRVGLLVVP